MTDRARVEPSMKIEGPYRKNSGWRCRILISEGVRKWCATGKTEEAAIRIAEEYVASGGQPPARPQEPEENPDSQVEEEPLPSSTPDTPEPARKMLAMRVEGPYPHRNGYRCRVVTPAGRVWCTPGKTEHHAWKIAERFVTLAAQQGKHSVKDAIAAYQAYQRDVKGNRPKSIVTTGHVLHRFFAPYLDQELARLTPQKGADLYERLWKGKGQKTKRPIAADTHRNYLLQARSFLSWCLEQNWIKLNSLERVKPVGQRSHGKVQLTIDEARRLYQHCLEVADKDDGALAVLMALGMGMRAGEIVSRTVRDLDDGGKAMRVEPNEALTFKPKTKASRRPVPISSDLQPLLKMRTQDKLPTALLFVSEKTGGPHWRDWVAEETHRLCKAVGVPVVCAHALRGVTATSAVEAGIAAEAVAKLLGHESASITRRAYIAPGTAEKQEREQIQKMLSGPPAP